MNQADRNGCLLLHACRQFLNLLMGEILNSKIGKQFFLTLFQPVFRYIVQPSEESEHVVYIKLLIQLDITGQESDTFAHRLRFLLNLVAIHIDLSLGRLYQCGNTPESRSLSRAVGTQKPIDLPFFCLQAQIIHRCLQRILRLGFGHLLFIQLIHLG